MVGGGVKVGVAPPPMHSSLSSSRLLRHRHTTHRRANSAAGTCDRSLRPLMEPPDWLIKPRQAKTHLVPRGSD